MSILKRWLVKRVQKIRMANAVRRSSGNLRIIIGAAATSQEGWISTDYPLLNVADPRTFAEWFASETVSRFLAEHVWEHLSPEDAVKACNNCFTYLRHGGLLRIAVPDGFHPDAEYIARVRPGGYGAGAKDHKVLFNHRTLSTLLEGAGFKLKLLEWFDEQGEFHHEQWEVAEGIIMRSSRFDKRNRHNQTAYTSLIIDAIKP